MKHPANTSAPRGPVTRAVLAGSLALRAISVWALGAAHRGLLLAEDALDVAERIEHALGVELPPVEIDLGDELRRRGEP